MRNIILATLAGTGLVLVGAAPAAAVGTHDPFCMQGEDAPALSDCSYTSYEQCAATASGRFLYCITNPYFSPDAHYATYPSGHCGRHHVRSVYPAY